jgi:hypothetical protein
LMVCGKSVGQGFSCIWHSLPKKMSSPTHGCGKDWHPPLLQLDRQQVRLHPRQQSAVDNSNYGSPRASGPEAS